MLFSLVQGESAIGIHTSPPSNTLVLTLSNKYEKETLICFMSIFWGDTKTLSRLFASKCTFVCFSFICKNLCLKASHLPVQVSSVAQSCLTVCDPMDCSTPGFPVHHQLLELTQTHVRQVGDAIQPSHPLSSSSPAAFNLSQHQGLLQ